jgi:dTDP-4-dehydrorhamnose reductase
MAALRQVLVLGATGRLGGALQRCYAARGIAVTALRRGDVDLCSPGKVAAALAGYDCDTIINAAGITDVDACERDPEQARLANVAGPEAVARYCAGHGVRMVNVSSDYVFAGDSRVPRSEGDATVPVNVYGRTKLEGERAVLAACPQAVVVRVSWLFGREKPSFPDWIISRALAGKEVRAVNDKWACPTLADDLADWMQVLLERTSHCGVIHLVNAGYCSWQEYGQTTLDIAARLGLPLKTRHVEGHTMRGFAPFIAQRPPFSALDTSLFTGLTGCQPRTWQAALEEYLREQYGSVSELG